MTTKTKSKTKRPLSEHRVYRRVHEGVELFLCRDCWSKSEPMKAVVPLGHGKLQ